MTYLSKEDLADLLKSRGFDTDLVQRAINQAVASHTDQKRDDGKPYLEEHVYPVAAEIIEIPDCSEEMVAGAILHDVLEDDQSISVEGFKEKFGQKIFDIVEPLTKTSEENHSIISQSGKMEINRRSVEKISKASRESILIKLADRTNNISNLDQIRISRPDKYFRYIKETKELFLPLAESNSDYFYKKMNAILDKYEVTAK